jgi:hypothetical protein
LTTSPLVAKINLRFLKERDFWRVLVVNSRRHLNSDWLREKNIDGYIFRKKSSATVKTGPADQTVGERTMFANGRYGS